MTTKHGRMVTYNEGHTSIMTNDSLMTWSHEITWQIKGKMSPLLQDMTTKLDRVVTYDEGNSSIMSDDPLITWVHATNGKLNSSFSRSMITKHGMLVTYGKKISPMESHNPLKIWWCVVTWQIKSITYLLWQHLWTWNLTKWWHIVRWMQP